MYTSQTQSWGGTLAVHLQRTKAAVAAAAATTKLPVLKSNTAGSWLVSKKFANLTATLDPGSSVTVAPTPDRAYGSGLIAQFRLQLALHDEQKTRTVLDVDLFLSPLLLKVLTPDLTGKDGFIIIAPLPAATNADGPGQHVHSASSLSNSSAAPVQPQPCLCFKFSSPEASSAFEQLVKVRPGYIW